MFDDLKNIGTANPWETRKETGFIKAFVQTIYQVAFRPGAFFSGLKIGASFTDPFLFYFLSSLLSFVIALPLSLALPGQPEPTPMMMGLMIVNFLISVFIIFVSAGVLHLIVKMFGGQAGYLGTFSVVAYASAISILSAIPILGVIITFVWGAVICVVGLKQIHQLNTARAVLSYFTLPVIFLIIAALIAFQSRGVCPVSRRAMQHQGAQPLPLPPR